MIDKLPVAVPGVVAANATSKLWLAPGARLEGTANPLVLNPAPVTVTSLMATPVAPLLVAVMVCEPILPTTAVTETLLGVTASLADCGPGFAVEEATPMQPEVQLEAAKRVVRNTRTAPRFKREEINLVVLLVLAIVFTAQRGSLRCASSPADNCQVRAC